MYPKLVRVKNFTYLRLIERVRLDNGKWGDRVVANLGRQDILGRKALGELLKKLRRFTDEVLVTPEEIESRSAKDYGSILAISKLWQDIGFDKWIRDACGKTPNVSLGEKGVLAMVLNRLTSPKSKLALYDWLKTVYIPNWPPKGNKNKILNLPEDPKALAQWFYRTMDWFISGKNKEKIEEKIALRIQQSLFNTQICFYDITNIQFEGWEKLTQARHGYIRLGRKNHKQILLGIVMIDGLPVMHHIFRGNRVEKTTLSWIKEKTKKLYNINRIVFVTDRGMISEENLLEIESSNDGYIVALKRRKCKEVEPLLKVGLESFVPIAVSPDTGETLLYAWEAPKKDNKRRIVVFNPVKGKEEKRKRDSIINEIKAHLEELSAKVKAGKIKKVQEIIKQAQNILSHKHAKRYFSYQAKEDGHFEFSFNDKSLGLENELDGKFIIKTTETDLTLKDVVYRYKDLMDIEDGFRELKDFIRVAPVFHWKYRRVKAHIFICVLALFLERYMEMKLKESGISMTARHAIESLKNIKVVENKVGHLNLKYVTPPSQELKSILAACGIFNLPKILQRIT